MVQETNIVGVNNSAFPVQTTEHGFNAEEFEQCRSQLKNALEKKYIEGEVRSFKGFIAANSGREFDACIVDCTAPGDSAFAVTSNFPDLKINLINKEFHSKAEVSDQTSSSNPIIIITTRFTLRTETAGIVERLRTDGYQEIYLLIGIADEHGLLLVDGLVQLNKEDYVSQTPALMFEYNYISDWQMLSESEPMINNNIGLNAWLFPAGVIREKISVT